MREKLPMGVVVLTSTQFGYRCLKEGILPIPQVRVKGILTTASEIRISYAPEPVRISTHVRFEDLAELAGQAGCDAIEIRDRISAGTYLGHLKRWQPDLLLALGWYYFLPRMVRESVPLGCLGIHASLLPRHRGGAPIPWAIMNGEARTGITLFHLEDQVDSGEIVAQAEFPISEDDTSATVYEKATRESIEVLGEYLPRISAGTAPRIKQDERKATYCPQRKPGDGLIDWSWAAQRVYNFLRALTRPYPGAFTYLGREKVVLWKGRLCPDLPRGHCSPGEIVPGFSDAPVSFGVCCGDARLLLVDEIGLGDGTILSGADFLTGRKISGGTSLGHAMEIRSDHS